MVNKTKLKHLACKGGKSLFDIPLPVGQLALPPHSAFVNIFSSVFKNKYYTNHGPQAQKFENHLEGLFLTKNAVTVTNATIGISLACKALGLLPGDKVIVPAFTFAATVQALTWAGLEPVFCDVDAHSHCITPQTVVPCLSVPGVKAILGVHLWGNACDTDGLEALAREHNLTVFYDAAHAVGCTHHGKKIGSFGACEIFSFHATKVLSTTEGGCVTTNDDDLAERIRNIRSSYGTRRVVDVPITANGRFSELQAAFGLLSLEDFPKNCADNKQRLELYAHNLEHTQGIRLLLPTPYERHNYQYVVLELDEVEFGLCRDAVVRILEAENILARRYFVPGMHRCPPYRTLYPQFVDALPVTDALCQRVMQLPSGQMVTTEHIEEICALIRFIHENASALREKI